MASKKFVFPFEEGDGKNKLLLGGKGANLCEMTQIGLNVPPGFTVTTEACNAFLENNTLPAGLLAEIKSHMQALEKKTGKQFGGAENPLLVSVRSGSAMSRDNRRARLMARTMNIEAGMPLPETSPMNTTSRSGPAAQTP